MKLHSWQDSLKENVAYAERWDIEKRTTGKLNNIKTKDPLSGRKKTTRIL
jgi:hypothetical protein